MLRQKIEILKNTYGVKQEAIISCLNSNRVTFGVKMKDNSFTDSDKNALMLKYGALIK
jgi:hypothetical protein